MTDKPTAAEGLGRVWADNGTSVDPDTGGNPTKVSDGWVQEIPPFEYMNWIQEFVTKFVNHVNERGIAFWDNLTSYPLGGLATSTVDDKTYISLIGANVGNEPSASPLEWKTLVPDIRTVIKQMTQTKVNDASLADDNELVLLDVPLGLWEFEAALPIESNVTPDFKFRMSNIVTDAVYTYAYEPIIVGPSALAAVQSKTNQDSNSLDNIVDFTADDGRLLRITGYLNVAALGDVAFQWAQNVSDAQTTRVLEGAWIRLSRP